MPAIKCSKSCLVMVHMSRYIFSDCPALFYRPVFNKRVRHKYPFIIHFSPALSHSLMADK